MKKSFIFSFCACMFFSSLAAQRSGQYTIMPGENIIEVIPQKELYISPGFQQGVVYFKDGAKSSAMLNYHLVFQEMHFIDAKGDTLSLLNPAEISSISIGKDQFYYEGKRYVRLDTIVGGVKLASAVFFAVLKKQKMGAYGNTTDGAAGSMNSFVTLNNSKLELVPQSVTTIALQNIFFLGNRFSQFLPVNKKNIFSFYNKKETELNEFLKKTSLNYSSRQDILNLVQYMSK